jgi:hypothetical protein
LWQKQKQKLTAIGLTNEKDASAFTSSPFDFVATGLRTIQFLFPKGALTQWYIPRNWSGGFYKAFFYLYFIKSGGPYKSGGLEGLLLVVRLLPGYC